MVIWFNIEKARRHLLEKGIVYTLRPKLRAEGETMLSYNELGKKGMVDVKFVKKIEDIGELNEYVNQSGFTTVDEWIKEAKESRFLYMIKIIWAKYELGD